MIGFTIDKRASDQKATGSKVQLFTAAQAQLMERNHKWCGESVWYTAGTDDVWAAQEKSLTDQWHVAFGADETLVVPMSVIEGRELGCTWSCTHDTSTTLHWIQRI